jgi:hypothetical protein
VELKASNAQRDRRGSLTMAPPDQVHDVHTIACVAKTPGWDEGWVWDIASQMDPENGLISIHRPGDVSRSPNLASKLSPP